ncbi:hypothetical protein ACFL5F_03445 [Planctomycetota bacterium]
MKEMLLFGAAVAIDPLETAAEAQESEAELPKIKLGQLEVSRLILGSNPFFGFAHDNPQASSDQMKEYYTDERAMQNQSWHSRFWGRAVSCPRMPFPMFSRGSSRRTGFA